MHSEFFWPVLRSKSPYSARMRENLDQKNSDYGHFLCSDSQIEFLLLYLEGVTNNFTAVVKIFYLKVDFKIIPDKN